MKPKHPTNANVSHLRSVFEATTSDIIRFFEIHGEGLIATWENAGGEAPNDPGYQGPTDGLSRMVFRGYGIFANRTVLDMGCNSGLNSLAISLVAKSVVGCDRDPVYINRAIAGLAYLQRSRTIDNVSFKVGDFTSYLSKDIDGIAAGRILYHIGDDNVATLRQFIQSRTGFAILVHTRPGRPASRTTTYNGLIEVSDVTHFLSDCGLSIADEWGSDRQRVLVAVK